MSQQPADFFVRSSRVPLMQPFKRRRACFNQSFVVLGEVSDRGFVSPDYFSVSKERAVVAAGFAQLGIRNCGRVRQQRVQHGSFSHTVAAQQRDFFSADHTRCEVSDYWSIVVGLRHTFEFQNVLARGTLLLKFQVWTGDVGPGQFRDLQPLHFLAA